MEKPRILLAESDPVVALHLVSEFADWGLVVADLADNLPRLISKVSTVQFDVALLAVCLGDDLTFEVARELKASRTPFAFITAFALDELPDDLQDVPLIEKPFVVSDVIRVVLRLTRFQSGAPLKVA